MVITTYLILHSGGETPKKRDNQNHLGEFHVKVTPWLLQNLVDLSVLLKVRGPTVST